MVNFKMTNIVTRIALAVLLGIIISIIFSSIKSFSDTATDLRHEVLRLHILANSNSEADQGLKLDVRDCLLNASEEIFESSKSLSMAKQNAGEKLERINEIARKEIKRQGYDYPVKVSLQNMYFSTRVYENFTLPAGEYDALRVEIGEAKGKNWWCVLYPPLCLPAASNEDELLESFNESELEIIKNYDQYQFKFAAIEIYEKIKSFILNH